MNFDQLKALKRPQLQKLARREGLKANGKNVDMIKQLLEKFPGGVPRWEEPEPKVENVRTRAAIGGNALDIPCKLYHDDDSTPSLTFDISAALGEPSSGPAGPVPLQQQQDVPPTGDWHER
ncbi:hypothetical protein NLI96_g11718 [Meripilus lineatus]|uniref:SAP domain-containing protein n=1 Tax=Meripilus lineatus TaxID=2056292 RepID=A0AAD5UR92_9APHY|nr:hypothetical protein NLI96_g11718 [Physisporinus lineatus]